MTDDLIVPRPPLTVVQFDALKTYPDAVAVLEDLLERAKAGEVIGVAAVLLLRDRQMATCYTEGIRDNIFLAIGTIDYLKFRMLNDIEGG